MVLAPHLVFGQGLTFAFLVLDTTRDPEGSDIGLDTAEVGRCGTGGVGHCAVKTVGARKADIRKGLEKKTVFKLPRISWQETKFRIKFELPQRREALSLARAAPAVGLSRCEQQ